MQVANSASVNIGVGIDAGTGAGVCTAAFDAVNAAVGDVCRGLLVAGVCAQDNRLMQQIRGTKSRRVFMITPDSGGQAGLEAGLMWVIGNIPALLWRVVDNLKQLFA
jgi:hypothetical protein